MGNELFEFINHSGEGGEASLNWVWGGEINASLFEGIEGEVGVTGFKETEVVVNGARFTIKNTFGEGVGAGDAGGVLVNVEIRVEVGMEDSPSDTDTVFIEFDFIAIPFFEEVSEHVGEAISIEGATLFDCFVDSEFEAGEGGHEEEVAMEIGHSFFDDGDLELGVVIGFEEVGTDEGLVKV